MRRTKRHTDRVWRWKGAHPQDRLFPFQDFAAQSPHGGPRINFPRRQNTDWRFIALDHWDLEIFLLVGLATALRREAYSETHPAHPHIAASHIHLGAIHKQAGDLEQALNHMSQALELQIQDVGTDQHPMIASEYNNVGALHFQMGQFHQVKEKYGKALEIHTALQGQDKNVGTAGTHHKGDCLETITGDGRGSGAHLDSIDATTRITLLSPACNFQQKQNPH